MSMLRYYVDLRSYPTDERDILAKKIETTAFLFTYLLDRIGVYEVFWDSETPITQLFEIPEQFVTTFLPGS